MRHSKEDGRAICDFCEQLNREDIGRVYEIGMKGICEKCLAQLKSMLEIDKIARFVDGIDQDILVLSQRLKKQEGRNSA